MKYIITLLLVIVLTSYSCTFKKSDKQPGKGIMARQEYNQSDKINDDMQANKSTSISHITFEIMPLTFNHYNDYINCYDTFSTISLDIDYLKNDNPYVSYHAGFVAGNLSGSRIFTDINSFESSFAIDHRPGNPYWLYGYKYDFTSSQMEALFNHIEAYHAFYFNNEEFANLQLPYISTSELLERNKKHNFTFVFSEPNPVMGENLHIYSISKSTDELTPESPLYELFQLFEEEYYPILIQHEVMHR